MSAKVQTSLGCAMPPATRHAITLHLPKWETIVRFANRDPELPKQFQSVYPRMMLQKDVKEASHRSLGLFDQTDIKLAHPQIYRIRKTRHGASMPSFLQPRSR